MYGKRLITALLIYAICFLPYSTQNEILFSPKDRVLVRLYKSAELVVTYRTNDSVSITDLTFNCSCLHENVARVYPFGNSTVDYDNSHSYNITFVCRIESVKLGRTNVSATISKTASNGSRIDIWALDSVVNSLQVIVAQPKSTWNPVVQYGLMAALALNSIAFGLKIDWSQVKEFLAKPCGILLAVGCQYVLLPLVAYLMGFALDMETHIRVALLAISCVPGGIPSNVITLALGGDINLSIVLTAIGNVAAFAMTPLWMYTLGQSILRESYPGAVISIPWLVFCIFIAILTVPTIAGIAVGVRHPKISAKLAQAIRLVGVSSGLVLVGIMLWVYEWVFHYFTSWRMVVAGITTPYIALIISFSLSMLALRSWKYSLTIAVETSIQNISFSFFLIGTSIPEPEASLATSIPAIIVLTTYVPLLVLSFARIIVEVVRSKRSKNEASFEDNITGSNSDMADSISATKDEKISGIAFDADATIKFHKSESTTVLV